MDQKMLPIGNPPVRGYLCNAYPLSIVSVNDGYLGWFYSNYIQLICTGDFPKRKFFSFYHPYFKRNDYFLACPLIDYQKIHVEFLANYRGGFIQLLMDSIDQGSYPIVYVNEYYVSHKEAYRKFHLPHEMMIFGYDKTRSLFHVVGYDGHRRFGKYEISYAELLESFVQCYKDKDYRSYIHLLKYNPSAEYFFDIKLVIHSIKEYLNSTNSSLPFRALGTPCAYIYGIEFYDHFINYLKVDLKRENEAMDVRLLYTLWEHKAVMSGRIAYLLSHHYLENAQLLDDFKEIERKCAINKSLATKLLFKRNHRILDDMVETLIKVKHDEPLILNDLLRELENAWGNADDRLMDQFI